MFPIRNSVYYTIGVQAIQLPYVLLLRSFRRIPMRFFNSRFLYFAPVML